MRTLSYPIGWNIAQQLAPRIRLPIAPLREGYYRCVTTSEDGYSYRLNIDHHPEGGIQRAALFGPVSMVQHYRQDGTGNISPCDEDLYFSDTSHGAPLPQRP